jgi:hypothetical protein
MPVVPMRRNETHPPRPDGESHQGDIKATHLLVAVGVHRT